MSEILPQLFDRIRATLAARERDGLLRELRVPDLAARGALNLADNDYLDLAGDPAVIEAAARAAKESGCGAGSSPLITGYRKEHRLLEDRLCEWMGFPSALLWTSGFAANQALLSRLPEKGDLVLADRLIHHSMVSGMLRGGARFLRFPHNDLDALEKLLSRYHQRYSSIFVATESVFSMDGDSPDLVGMADLKKRFPYVWILDEAHSLGWYGPAGSGLAAKEKISGAVDVLVGTLGKTLGSQGAFTLFRDKQLREFLINESGEFIFSTYLSPIAAAAAAAAVNRCKELACDQRDWQRFSEQVRAKLQSDSWNASGGNSPIIPVSIGDAAKTVAIGRFLRGRGILAGAVRPPAVPANGSRLRLSLKRTLVNEDANRLLEALNAFRE